MQSLLLLHIICISKKSCVIDDYVVKITAPIGKRGLGPRKFQIYNKSHFLQESNNNSYKT